ncbi:MAG TPA: hypothetical protein VJO14_06530 [Bacteroidota bacterium]|nr:hypothetical protein [Bacteroidota bacterium]
MPLFDAAVEVLREDPEVLELTAGVFAAGAAPVDVPPVTALPEAAGRSIIPGTSEEPADPLE